MENTKVGNAPQQDASEHLALDESASHHPEQDVPHQPAPEQDVPHQPAPEQDVPHHPAPEQDVPHQPAPEQDVPHQPAPEQDVPHQPAPEQDVPHHQTEDEAASHNKSSHGGVPRLRTADEGIAQCPATDHDVTDHPPAAPENSVTTASTAARIKQGSAMQEMELDQGNLNSNAAAEPLTWRRVGRALAIALLLVLLLYLFVCALDLLAKSVRLIGGRTASDVFAKTLLLGNPVVGLMMGCLVTVLVQSSSTSTSIIVSMVASDVVSVRSAIPMVMGANIGTSITNDIVSLTQFPDREVFQRAFAGACVYDMFNLLSVLVMLPLELIVQAVNPSGEGYLEYVTSAILDATKPRTVTRYNVQLLQLITRPLTDRVVMLDEVVLEHWAQNITSNSSKSLVIRDCNATASIPEHCSSLFSLTSLRDDYVGLILLLVSLCLMSLSLFAMVKIYVAIFKGPAAARLVRKINADLPWAPWLSGYLAMLVGCGVTVLMQSSSVFTSTLTPLVGCGAISVERMYEVTIGANVGTTMTALLAALAVGEPRLRPALHIALVHLLFNVSGAVLFYIPPPLRWPLPLAKRLSAVTARYRWFALVYLALAYALLPAALLAVHALAAGAAEALLAAAAALLAFVAVVSALQRWAPGWLPRGLRTWRAFVAEPCRSLEPYDRAIRKVVAAVRCRAARSESSLGGRRQESSDEEDGEA